MRLGRTAASLGVLAAMTGGAAIPMAHTGESPAARLALYVGTYTGSGSKGIYRLEMDQETGALSEPRAVAEAPNPTFLAVHPSGRWLYAACEVGEWEGRQTGFVAAYEIHAYGGLREIGRQSSHGTGPCHVALDRTGRSLLVANYGSGSVAVLPIGRDGRLGEATSAVQHRGSSVNKDRQEGPHAHSINAGPDNRFVYAADLGMDQVLIYRFDAERGSLNASDPPCARVAPGSGPRHLAFHPNGKTAYVINELLNTVTAFRHDPASGALQEIQTIGTLPEGWKGTSYTAEVVVHPSGRFLYGSNRGHDSIAVFSIQEDGRLKAAGHVSSGGQWPRNFCLDPAGRFLLAANQNSDSVVVFRIDMASGRLSPTGHRAAVPKPVCIRFLPSR